MWKKHCCTADGGNADWSSHCGSSVEVSQKTKNRTTIRPSRASLVAQLVKNPLAMQETPVQFLGQEVPLKKGQATHSWEAGLPW